jgi:DNA polymerase-3 subunit gamma/tau
MPTPGELLARLDAGAASATPARGSAASAAPPAAAPASAERAPTASRGAPPRGPAERPLAALAFEDVVPAPEPVAYLPLPQSFRELVELIGRRKEGVLHAQLMADVHLVHYEPGRIEFSPGRKAPADLASRLGKLLQDWTGQRWVIAISSADGEPSLKEQADAERAAVQRELLAHPLVQAALASFPGATIEAVRDLKGAGAAAPPPAATDNDEDNA